MKFIMKLFKALNSAQSPWQVTLAIVLGMIAGLTPISGIQTVVILLLAFVLNVHLGLFFVASGLFAGVAYVFDPVFEQVGYALLLNESLEGVWTACYNNGLMRLTHFNNTLVLGSTLLALLLALPIYLLLGWLIRRYRENLSGILSRYPHLGLFGILKVSDTTDPLLRWWGAGVFGGVAALLAFFVILLADPLAKWSLENGASRLLQRDVRIGAVDIGFGSGSVAIDRLEVAGTTEGVDAFSAERIALDIDLNALLFKRTHIDRIAVNGVGFDTKATLQKSAAKESAEPAASEDAAAGPGKGIGLPAFELPTPEAVLAGADLKSMKVYEEAKAEIGQIRTKWEKVAQTEFTDEVTASFKQDLDALKQQSKSRDPQQLLKLKNDITAFKKKIDERKQRIAQLQKEFKADQQRIKELSSLIQNAPMQDFNHLKSAYSLDGSGAMNIIGTLFGEKIKGYIAMAEKYYALLSPYLASGKKPVQEVPPRGEGRWIKFSQHVAVPELLIKRTEVDGALQAQNFSATLTDVTDNQKAVGRPIVLNASSDGTTISGLKLHAEDNRLGDEVSDSVAFSVKKLPLDAMTFSALTVANTALALNGDVRIDDSEKLHGTVHLAFADASVSMKNLEGKTATIVAGVLESVHHFNADVEVGGTLKAPEVGVKTDLDKKLAGAFGEGLKKEAAAYEGKLKTMLNEQMKTQLQSFNGDASNVADINALAGSQNSMLNNLGSDAGSLASGGGIKNMLPF